MSQECHNRIFFRDNRKLVSVKAAEIRSQTAAGALQVRELSYRLQNSCRYFSLACKPGHGSTTDASTAARMSV